MRIKKVLRHLRTKDRGTTLIHSKCCLFHASGAARRPKALVCNGTSRSILPGMPPLQTLCLKATFHRFCMDGLTASEPSSLKSSAMYSSSALHFSICENHVNILSKGRKVVKGFLVEFHEQKIFYSFSAAISRIIDRISLLPPFRIISS